MFARLASVRGYVGGVGVSSPESPVLGSMGKPSVGVGVIASTMATYHVGAAVFRVTLRDRRGFISTLLTPVLILLAFWLGARGQARTMDDLFAACIGLSAMMAGSTHATRLVSWREQGVLQRLACAPVPIGHLLAGIGLGQVLSGTLQALLVLAFGVGALGLDVNVPGIFGSAIVLALGALCFVAFGSLIAQIANHAEGANALYVFSMLPMFFLGGGVPAHLLPVGVQTAGGLTPVGIVSSALSAMLSPVAPHAPSLAALGLLLVYTAGFSALAARLFRVE